MSISAEDLLMAYVQGVFPMGNAENEIDWYSPDPRAIIPFENYKPSKSLKPILNKGNFILKIDTVFKEVMQNCAKPRYEGDETWISEEIINSYCELHKLGYAHSVEIFENKILVGGLYGVSIGAAFFGESMFHLVSNASKIAFHNLIIILKANNFNCLIPNLLMIM